MAMLSVWGICHLDLQLEANVRLNMIAGLISPMSAFKYFQNWLFKKKELINFEFELKFPTKELNPQINLSFNSEIFLTCQSYLEHKLVRVGKKWNWYIWNWSIWCGIDQKSGIDTCSCEYVTSKLVAYWWWDMCL